MLSTLKTSLTQLSVVILLCSSVSAFADDALTDTQKTAVEAKVQGLSKFLQNRRMIGAVVQENKKHVAISDDKIQELDKKWRAGTDASWIKSLMSNKCAKSLTGFMKRHPAFLEIFITNANGLNVCQTGRTSDYYQADEGWWQKAYADGKGKLVFGKIKFDESVGKKGVAVSLPIVNPLNKSVIGVCKAVLDVGSL